VLHLCLASIVAYTVVAFIRPAYTEWVESGVLSVAKYWVNGGNIYPDAQTLGRFGVFPYGPLLFQAVGGVYAAFGGSARAVRVAYICLAAAAYFLMYVNLRRGGIGVRGSALAVEMLAVVVGIMGFMVKADIMLVFVAVLACGLVVWGSGQIRVGLALAVLAGAAAAIKIHGVFYVLPAAVECLAMRKGWWAAKTAAAGMIAAGVAAAPFLVPGTSFANYVSILRLASQDGLLFGIFLSNVVFIGMCVLGVHAAGEGTDAAYRRLLVSVLVAGVLVSVFAAKSEAGPHHLIPLLPYLCLPLGRAVQGRATPRRMVLFVLFLVSFQPVTGVVGDLVLMARHWGTVRAVI
jgi:hypothetical protein